MARVTVKGTRKSVINKRRRGFLAIFFPWMRRFGIALAALALFAWLGAWLVLSGTLARGKDWVDNQILMATKDMGFQVENILVEGREHADPQVLLAMINVQKGDPLFSFNPSQAHDLISKISWVDQVRVERRWPDTIYIGLTERQPLALWQDGKTLKLLDTKGEVIATDRPERFKNLMLVMGDDAPAHVSELLQSLNAEPDLARYIKAANRMGDRRWDLLLDKNVVVKLPENDMQLALSKLAKAQSESAILQKDIESIDLREEGRLVVKTRPGAVEEYKASLKMDGKTGNNI